MGRVMIVDGTLREGEQTPGVHFTTEEKVRIAAELDRIGVPLLDVGMPCISAAERTSISEIARQGLKATVGVSVRLNHREVDLARECGARDVFVICPVSRLHMHSKLGMDKTQVRGLAEDVVRYGIQRGMGVNLVAEDASRAEPGFLCEMVSAAWVWGARRAFICDTVGILDPFGTRALIGQLRERIPEEMALGIHCHDDLGLSTANTLAAVQAGADYPAVTVNGMGERAGNAPLHEVAVGMEKILKRDHGVDIKGLYDLSRMVEACSGVFIQPHTPIVGFNAFRHESGIHVDGILKHQQMYHGVDPEDVKRPSSIVLGTHTGTGTIRHLLAGRGYDADDTAVEEILRRVKKKKANEGKKDINRMVKQIDDFYSRRLSFPEKDFWEIVERVLDSGGQRDIR